MSEVIPSFKTRLETFARNPSKVGDPWGLKSLLSSMTAENLNPASVKNLTQQTGVNVPDITTTTLDGPFIVDSIRRTTMDEIFTNEATVLVFGSDGLPIGFYEMANGDIHRKHGVEKFGYTLLPYAGRKAARARFLEAKGYHLGIRGINANRLLRNIGPESIGVFPGDAVVDLSDSSTRKLLVIGVSGAQLRNF